MTIGALAPVCTAESIAASSRAAGLRALAKSMTVRVALVLANPLTRTRSMAGRSLVECTVSLGPRWRWVRATVNSTAPDGVRSKPWRWAAASWLTTAVSPRVSFPSIRDRSVDAGTPAMPYTRGATRRSQPLPMSSSNARRPTPSVASWAPVTRPCCGRLGLVIPGP